MCIFSSIKLSLPFLILSRVINFYLLSNPLLILLTILIFAHSKHIWHVSHCHYWLVIRGAQIELRIAVTGLIIGPKDTVLIIVMLHTGNASRIMWFCWTKLSYSYTEHLALQPCTNTVPNQLTYSHFLS